MLVDTTPRPQKGPLGLVTSTRLGVLVAIPGGAMRADIEALPPTCRSVSPVVPPHARATEHANSIPAEATTQAGTDLPVTPEDDDPDDNPPQAAALAA